MVRREAIARQSRTLLYRSTVYAQLRTPRRDAVPSASARPGAAPPVRCRWDVLTWEMARDDLRAALSLDARPLLPTRSPRASRRAPAPLCAKHERHTFDVAARTPRCQ